MISRVHRFHGRNSLNYVYKHGQTLRATDITLRYTTNNQRSQYRCAVVVSKKVSKSAVVRNRIRRRIYEVVRMYWLQKTPESQDLVFSVFNESFATITPADLQTRIFQLLDRIFEKS